MNRLTAEYNTAKSAFKSTYRLGFLNNQQYWKIGNRASFRIGTFSVDSAISDICQCIVNSTEKRAKRIARIKLIKDVYQSIGYEFAEEVIVMIDSVSELTSEPDITIPDTELIAKLTSELNHEDGFQNGKLFFDISGEFIPPMAKAFHGHCTKEVNKLGNVYDMMTQIATITLFRLLQLQSSEHDECEQELLAGIQLIFKGGAALGKFLFQKQEWWSQLTDEMKTTIHTSFISGGDNDTSFYFGNIKQVKEKFGMERVSNQIAKIAEKTDAILFAVCEEHMLFQNLPSPDKTQPIQVPFVFGGQTFDFQSREASGFRLTKHDANTMCLTPHQRHVSKVFTTQSKVEFNINEKTIKFELVRAKLGFVAHSQQIQLNTYSELLDISMEYPDSASLFKKVFVEVSD